ncbi:hypothetical protein AGR4A_Cc190193 [Agrobacterium tumefaciens str. B6]|uniref:Uncharacterized protein n=1 Tax=Agrobacterium tumefaciens str. B6 TaxID=1183423 RepID=A0A822UYB5_AGRTU|nr:hypothetical protein AGR4B_Cc60379 [Agrobacterium tumefaciens str. CFBP 5621]CVI15542.1 hypothetical protein AGR4A_Cc190193 [Agrobacterium tumefaciens str. B6]
MLFSFSAGFLSGPAVSWHMQVTYLLFDGERQSLKGLPF